MGTGMNVGQLIAAGGPLMWPILFCSVLALAITLSKLIYFGKIRRTNTIQLKRRVFELVKENKIKEAVEFCNAHPSPVASILRSGVLKFGCSREEIKAEMEGASLFEIPQLGKNLSLLATIANVTPLLGLLGTVNGMIITFQTIQARSASLSAMTPGDLAAGIWQALLTTVAGLMVAIPAFVAYNYCVSQVDSLILDMERTATELVNFLCHLSETNLAQTDNGDFSNFTNEQP